VLFISVSYPDVGAAPPPSTIAFSQLGRSSVQGLCDPIFLGDTLVEEPAAHCTAALTMTFLLSERTTCIILLNFFLF